MKNLERVVPCCCPATTSEAGRDLRDLDELYGRLVSQWAHEMITSPRSSAASTRRRSTSARTGVALHADPARSAAGRGEVPDRQRVRDADVFLRDDILRKIEVEGALRRINQAQTQVLGPCSTTVAERMIEYPALTKSPADAYSLGEMLADVRAGIWTELGGARVTIDPFRRELQRSWLTIARNKLNPPPLVLPPGFPPQFAQLVGPARATSDVRSLFRSELRAVQSEARAAIPKATNRETRAHLEDVRDQIEQLLNPR